MQRNCSGKNEYDPQRYTIQLMIYMILIGKIMNNQLVLMVIGISTNMIITELLFSMQHIFCIFQGSQDGRRVLGLLPMLQMTYHYFHWFHFIIPFYVRIISYSTTSGGSNENYKIIMFFDVIINTPVLLQLRLYFSRSFLG